MRCNLLSCGVLQLFYTMLHWT